MYDTTFKESSQETQLDFHMHVTELIKLIAEKLIIVV